MILSQISLIDCFVFVILLAPQLLIDVGLRETVVCAAQSLPFLLFRMPKQLFKERYRTPRPERSPFVQRATLFQDLVIRCVRYAFAYIPASVGAVFFSRKVSIPFMRFRMLRHGYLRSPFHINTITTYSGPSRKRHRPGGKHKNKGIWIIKDNKAPADVVVYYCHGGGFSMGSAAFYLEFLIAWVTLLTARQGFRNPAIFALDYTLVPNACFPTQVQEVRAGYEFVLRRVKDWDPGRVCLAGDSAGATLVLSLLLSLAQERQDKVADANHTADGLDNPSAAARRDRAAGFVTLISPWCRLISDLNKDTPSDFLNAASLHLYARQYMGTGKPQGTNLAYEALKYENGSVDSTQFAAPIHASFVSPGDCEDRELWAAMPTRGFHFVYGAEEVFAPETEALIAKLKAEGCQVDITREPGSIHAWPVVNLFLGNTRRERLKGLDKIVDVMGRNMVI